MWNDHLRPAEEAAFPAASEEEQVGDLCSLCHLDFQDTGHISHTVSEGSVSSRTNVPWRFLSLVFHYHILRGQLVEV